MLFINKQTDKKEKSWMNPASRMADGSTNATAAAASATNERTTEQRAPFVVALPISAAAESTLHESSTAIRRLRIFGVYVW